MKKNSQKRKSRSPYKKSHYFFQKRCNLVLKPTPAIKELIKYLDKINFIPESVLDLGCGNGRNSYILAEKYGCEITLVDKQPQFLRKASQNLKKSGFKVKKEILSEIEKIDLQDLEKYDIVLCNYVLQNIHPNRYCDIISLFHSVTNKFIVIEIYQNPDLYETGKFTLRGSIGWYGFSKREMMCLVYSNFDIIWKNGSVRDKGGPTTINFILSPRFNFRNHSLIIFKRRFKSIALIEGEEVFIDETKNYEKYGVSNNIYPDFLALYPPCQTCNIEVCHQYHCVDLKHWMGSKSSVNKCTNKIRDQLKEDYPICAICNYYICLGINCPRLVFWVREIINEFVKTIPNPNTSIPKYLNTNSQKSIY